MDFANPGDMHKLHFMPELTQGWILRLFRFGGKNTITGDGRRGGHHRRPRSANKDFQMPELHSFSDFAAPRFSLAGKKRRMEEILNTPLTVTAYKIIASKRNAGESCLQLQFDLGGETCIVFTGSAVLADQCETYADRIPFRAEIRKIDKYFSFA